MLPICSAVTICSLPLLVSPLPLLVSPQATKVLPICRDYFLTPRPLRLTLSLHHAYRRPALWSVSCFLRCFPCDAPENMQENSTRQAEVERKEQKRRRKYRDYIHVQLFGVEQYVGCHKKGEHNRHVEGIAHIHCPEVETRLLPEVSATHFAYFVHLRELARGIGGGVKHFPCSALRASAAHYCFRKRDFSAHITCTHSYLFMFFLSQS